MEEDAAAGSFQYGFGSLLQYCNNNSPAAADHDHLLLSTASSSTNPPSLAAAIDRFLWSPNEYLVDPSKISSSEMGYSREFPPSATNWSANGLPLPCTNSISQQDMSMMSFVDGFFAVDGNKPCNMVDLRGDDHHDHAMKLVGENKKKSSTRRVLDKGSSHGSFAAPTAVIIKGQWTDEEDSLLIRLVKQYGVRKWAQIAQRLVGRAGKQCRERWHNHLRPDIKKDSWSEEEERLLIEAHEKIGNKWAEIAKQIPGRTENSIKNHWNATKRRLNSRRKNKKSASQRAKLQPSILQDYIIKRKNLEETSSSTSSSRTTTTISPTSSFSKNPLSQFDVTLPEQSDSSYFPYQAYDDELLFVEKFFENICIQQSNADEHYDLRNEVAVSTVDPSHQLMNPIDPNPNLSYTASNDIIQNQLPINSNQYPNSHTTSHMFSDLYISSLLNGDYYTCNSSHPFLENPNFDLQVTSSYNQDHHQSYYSTGNMSEMDLIEMVSSTVKY